MQDQALRYNKSRGCFYPKNEQEHRCKVNRLALTTIDQMFVDADFKTVLIDLADAEGIDSTTLGQLAKISIISKEKFDLVPSIISPREDIMRILLSMGFDKVFYLIGDMPEQISDLNELTCEHVDEELLRDRVIAAHEILMSLNDDNKNTFQELVDCLQMKNNRN